MPECREITGLVVFFPPATGDKGEQLAEAQTYSERGQASFLYLPPHLREKSGGMADPEGELLLWRRTREEAALLCRELLKKLNPRSQRLAFVGKNLGGSLAAYSFPAKEGLLVATGSMPLASRFWAESRHPVAVQARRGLSAAQVDEFRLSTQKFDLCESLRQLPAKMLVQFGTRDTWIDPSAEVQFGFGPGRVEWLNDDHSMNSVEARASRRRFLLER